MYNDDTTLDYPTYMPLAVLEPVQKVERRLTLQAYLRREEKNEGLAFNEYYNGVITKLPLTTAPHNIITVNISAALKYGLKLTHKIYRIRLAQQLVYLPKLNVALYPDALVVSDTPQYFDKNEVLLINPILIVEVLSKGTKKYDRTDKFDEYRTLDSFREYVLIDQKRCHIELRYREAPDTWHYSEVTDMKGIILLKSLGLSIAVADIYDNIKV